MIDPLYTGVIAASLTGGIAIASMATLKGWQGWLDLKRMELVSGRSDAILPPTGGRIEIADLKERVRKLEAIAAGIDL